jgi:hypothetical protein
VSSNRAFRSDDRPRCSAQTPAESSSQSSRMGEGPVSQELPWPLVLSRAPFKIWWQRADCQAQQGGAEFNFYVTRHNGCYGKCRRHFPKATDTKSREPRAPSTDRQFHLGLAASTALHEHLRQCRRQRNRDVPYHNLISRFINRAATTNT